MVSLTPRYSVFLSYNRGDGKAAQRIQRWLETYRLPRRLQGGGLAIAVLAVVLALVVQNMNARLAEEKQRVRAGTLSNYMLDDLRAQLKRAGRLDLLTAVNDGVAKSWRGQDLSGLSDADLQQRAKLLLAIAEDDESRGDLVAARNQTEEAMRTTAQLLAKSPDDPERIFAHAQSQYYTGMISWRGGDRKQAATAFAAYRDLAARLLASDGKKPDWWMEAGYAENNLGVLALRARLDTAAAQGHFLAALKAFAAADALRPGNRDTLFSLADTEAWLADTQRIAGAPALALAARARQKAILDQLAATDPQDRQVTADLVSYELALARIAIDSGRPDTALPPLASGRGKAQALAANDPQNVRRKAQVRMFDLMRLKALLAMPAARSRDDPTLAALNGDCEADLNRLKNDELADFCRILAARRGATAIAAGGPALAARGDLLTDQWGLDLAQERRLGGMMKESAR